MPIVMTRRQWAALLAAPAVGPRPLRAAAFRADATPPLGEPLIWVTPAKQVLDPLWAKGVVLDDGRQRIVLCAVDWCGIGGSTYTLFRDTIAKAAGTPAHRVSVHSVHQHTAPYIDGDAYTLMRQAGLAPLLMSTQAIGQITSRIAGAVRGAIARLQPIDRIGVSQAAVEAVASARRIIDNGALVTRFSTGGRDSKIAALPEGDVDPHLRTITLANADQPVARLHYYATHPQTFCCDGRVTADFVGAAREQQERDEGVPQIYFTGCAGDVTVGKYNDTSSAAYDALQLHLLQALKASAAATRYTPAQGLQWNTATFLPPRRQPTITDLRTLKGSPDQDIYRAAITAAFARRKQPLAVNLLRLGDAQVLHLPGEPMLDFQKFARQLAPQSNVAVAGYGDISPGYLCTDEALRQGGYEPSASNAAAGTETILKNLIQELVAR
jgi:hypothetical protein